MDVTSFFSRSKPAVKPAAGDAGAGGGQGGGGGNSNTPFDPNTGKPNPNYKAGGGQTGAGSGDPENLNSPLATYAGMFDNTPKDGEQAPKGPPAFSLDPERVKAVSSKLKFSGHVTPEVAEALGIAPDKLPMLQEVFDGLGRQVYEQSLSHGSTLTEQWANARLSHDRQGLDGNIRSVLDDGATAAMTSKNPAVKRIVDNVRTEVRRLFPDATSEEVASHVKSYLTEVASVINPDLKKGGGNGQGGSGEGEGGPEFDWGKDYFALDKK